MTQPGRFGPLRDTHPLVGRPCVLCGSALEVGDRPALLHSGRAEGLNVECDPAHERCVFPAAGR